MHFSHLRHEVATVACVAITGFILSCSPPAIAADTELNVYNWSDYIVKDTIPNFEKESGIYVRYDNYDNDDTLQAKLLAGSSRFNIVVPSLNYMAREIQAGMLQKLDKSQIPNLKNLDPVLMKMIAGADPGSYVGIGVNYTQGNWAWKFLLGNEQYRTNGAITQTGTNALGDPITTSNRVPTFTARVDYTWSSALNIGASVNIGKQTLPSAIDPATGTVSYGVSGQAPNAYGMFFFSGADLTYMLAGVQYNVEFDYGQQQNAASMAVRRNGMACRCSRIASSACRGSAEWA